MKRFFSIILCLCLAFTTFGCNKSDDKTYKISWYDGSSVCSVEVKTGELFTMPSIPQKEGYRFVGLFDAEENGTMYADAAGIAVFPWKEESDKRLYIRWQPIETDLVLDYQGGIEGEKRITVSYQAPLSLFPVSYKENYEFKGWYSQPHCQGVRLADENGRPLVSTLAPEYFQAEQTTVYAGFEGRKFEVVFYIGDSSDMKEYVVTAQYGQKIVDVQPVELFENKAVLSWSTNMNGGGEIYTRDSLLTQEIKLYSQEFAPVIRFETMGGMAVSPIIAKEGTIVTLPVGTRSGYVFGGWETEEGALCPANWTIGESTVLRAVWLRTLTLRGASVNSTENYRVGTQIALQTDTRDNSIFAGWFDEDATVVETTFTMPDANVTLKAGWYERKTEQHNISMEEKSAYTCTGCLPDKYSVKIPESWPKGGDIQICVDIKSMACYPQVAVYSKSTYTSDSLIKSQNYPAGSEEYSSYAISLSNTYSMIYIKVANYRFRPNCYYYKNLYLLCTYYDRENVMFS